MSDYLVSNSCINGEFNATVEAVDFADLNRDGNEDAIVILSLEFPTRRILERLYIFSEDKAAPKQIWSYSSGKYDPKGFKSVKIENYNVIIEEFNTKDFPLCCPENFYQSIFEWNNGTFVKKSETLIPFDKSYRGLANRNETN